jgi:hypothetical protein
MLPRPCRGVGLGRSKPRGRTGGLHRLADRPVRESRVPAAGTAVAHAGVVIPGGGSWNAPTSVVLRWTSVDAHARDQYLRRRSGNTELGSAWMIPHADRLSSPRPCAHAARLVSTWRRDGLTPGRPVHGERPHLPHQLYQHPLVQDRPRARMSTAHTIVRAVLNPRAAVTPRSPPPRLRFRLTTRPRAASGFLILD